MDGNMETICGFDEAGRGPLAGSVSGGCVIRGPGVPVELLNDSKKLTEKKREKILPLIQEKCLWGLGLVEHYEIDKINILQASLLAMKRAFEDMWKKKDEWSARTGIVLPEEENLLGIADGLYVPDVPFHVDPVVKADGKYPCVMAASIVAKVIRDHIMIEYDSKYPEYGYAKHKGYPTPSHKEICRKIGPSPIQRLSFKY